MFKAHNVKLYVLFLAALLLWCFCAFGACKLKQATENVSVRLDKGISPAALELQLGFLRQDGADLPNLTLWQQGDEEDIFACDMEIESKILNVYGNGSDVVMADMVSGRFPVKGEEKTCAISLAIANRLWGSHDVIGRTLTLGSTDYIIMGVFQNSEFLTVVQAPLESQMNFTQIQIGAPLDESRLLLEKCGFSMFIFMDYPLWAWAADKLVFTPAYLMVILVLSKLLAHLYTVRHYPIHFMGFLILVISFICIIYFFLGKNAGLPERLTPTRWADFWFWVKVVLDQVNSARLWLKTPNPLDFYICSWMLLVLVTSICTTALVSIICSKLLSTSRSWTWACAWLQPQSQIGGSHGKEPKT